MKIEFVRWIDSGMHLPDAWAKTDVYQRSAQKWNGEVTTVGFVIYEDEKVIVLGLSRDEASENYFGAQLIYKPCIVYRNSMREALNG